VVKQGLKLAGMGILTGIPAAYGLMRLMSSLLFGISPSAPMTFIGIALVMAVVALLASYFPARKATKVDPMIALRCE
jgi:ABC-type antimicrobial peptide transport system permease subunit